MNYLKLIRHYFDIQREFKERIEVYKDAINWAADTINTGKASKQYVYKCLMANGEHSKFIILDLANGVIKIDSEALKQSIYKKYKIIS